MGGGWLWCVNVVKDETYQQVVGTGTPKQQLQKRETK